MRSTGVPCYCCLALILTCSVLGPTPVLMIQHDTAVLFIHTVVNIDHTYRLTGEASPDQRKAGCQNKQQQKAALNDPESSKVSWATGAHHLQKPSQSWSLHPLDSQSCAKEKSGVGRRGEKLALVCPSSPPVPPATEEHVSCLNCKPSPSPPHQPLHCPLFRRVAQYHSGFTPDFLSFSFP